MDVYVVLKDQSEDLGEGYTSSSFNELLGIAKDFETARGVIEILVDERMNDCSYAIVDEETWDVISLDLGDYGDTYESYHINQITL